MAGNPLVNMMGNAMMQNNPLMQIVNMAKSGKGNPMEMIQRMAGQNPQMQQVMQMVSGKDQSQVNDIIAKMAKEKGVDLTQLAQSIGMPAEIQKKFNIG